MSNANIAWCILSLSIVVSFILGKFMEYWGYGVDGFPPWLMELHGMYFLFSLIFLLIAGIYKFYAKKELLLRGNQLFMGWLFTFYVTVVLILRFTFDIHYAIAYCVPFFVCILIPFYSFLMLYPFYTKRKDLDKISPQSVYQIAITTPNVQSFLQCFPSSKVYAYQTERKHHQAKCIFVHRRKRDERPEMMEDIILDVTINTNAKPPQIVHEECSRYLFHDGEEGSAVIHLSSVHEIKMDAFNQPLEYINLTQFDSAFERYPLLGDLPLALALWQGSFIEINH